MEPVLAVKNLGVEFETPEGPVSAVNDLSFDIAPGETLAVVGESGSGKSQTFLALMGLLARNGRATGEVLFKNRNLLTLNRKQLDTVRGADIAMVFQDPMTALNPSIRISRQLTETLEAHRGMSGRDAERTAIEMLECVGVPDAAQRFRRYPHELSGGLRQRVMIAMALLCQPTLLIADEPTTALDVTIQAQILDLFKDIKAEFGTALVMITHDLAVVAGLADRVMVMYGGRAVETAPVDPIFASPAHPYMKALLASTPRVDLELDGIEAIPGRPPNLQNLPAGCAFEPRCSYAVDQCRTERPALRRIADARQTACFRAEDVL